MLKFKKLTRLTIFLAAGALASCSPEINIVQEVDADFTAFEVKGQISSKIDIVGRNVEVVIKETDSPASLNIEKVRMTKGAICSDPNISAGKQLDLTSPKSVTLTTYRDFDWTISAVQPVDRYVYCEKQLGEAVIHADTRSITIFADVDPNSYIDSRTSLKILDMKLELVGSKVVATTDYKGNRQEITGFPIVLDCLFKRTFTVEHGGKTTEWSMLVLPGREEGDSE